MVSVCSARQAEAAFDCDFARWVAFFATHFPNAFDLSAFVPYSALNASLPIAVCSVLQACAGLAPFFKTGIGCQGRKRRRGSDNRRAQTASVSCKISLRSRTELVATSIWPGRDAVIPRAKKNLQPLYGILPNEPGIDRHTLREMLRSATQPGADAHSAFLPANDHPRGPVSRV